MPCLEISMPKANIEIKRKLTEKLTNAFAENTRFGAEIFGIRFHEYDPSSAASGGVLCEDKGKRPYLHMLLYIPRIDRATKQNLVKSFSKVFTGVLGQPDWLPVIHICEHPYDNIGVGGELLSEQFEELRDKKFYYEVGE